MKPFFKIVGVGEILWDILPTSAQLGGAPANFAYMASLLGDEGMVASRIGADPLGQDTFRRMAQLGLDTQFLQLDSQHPTGTACVSLDSHGQPVFSIAGPVSWDFLEWTPAWEELAAQADVICFGTLAQRSSQSRATVRRFLHGARRSALRVLDVNLRQDFFRAELLEESLRLCQVLKVNHEELPVIIKLLGLHGGEQESSAQTLLGVYGLHLVCVTRGANGSLLVTASGCSSHAGFPVEVADTVGAGDAFTAGLVHHLLRGSSLEHINQSSNRFAASVASQPGATPPRDPKILEWVLQE